VTEPLGYFKTDGFFKWRLRVGEREANAICKRAASIGNRIDEIIKSGVYECTKKDSVKTKNCLKAFLRWREKYDVKTILQMERITDHSIGLTGEPDIYWVENRRLIDIKATNNMWPTQFMQLGGYRRLGVDCDGVAILQLDPENGVHTYITNEMLGLTLADLVDAYESVFKYYKYYTYIEQQLKGEIDGHSTDAEVSSNA
jgi:hypothetical protein